MANIAIISETTKDLEEKVENYTKSTQKEPPLLCNSNENILTAFELSNGYSNGIF